MSHRSAALRRVGGCPSERVLGARCVGRHGRWRGRAESRPGNVHWWSCRHYAEDEWKKKKRRVIRCGGVCEKGVVLISTRCVSVCWCRYTLSVLLLGVGGVDVCCTAGEVEKEKNHSLGFVPCYYGTAQPSFWFGHTLKTFNPNWHLALH